MTDETKPEIDKIESFAADLRRLRQASGSPTFQALHRTTGISKTVLSDALKGDRLPTEPTVSGLVTAFGEDPAPWCERRERIRRSLNPVDEPTRTSSTVNKGSGGRVISVRKAAILALVASLVVGAIASVTTGILVSNQAQTPQASAPSPTETSQALPAGKTGDNIFDSKCVNDGKIIASEERAEKAQLQILMSNRCNSLWARVTRYDGKAYGNTIAIRIYDKNEPSGPLTQQADAKDVQTILTTMIVQKTVTDQFCAVASYTTDGRNVDLGLPICV
ncbi:helix-turn-helix transcriptional regulator [Arthrobacter sp. CJ23]|uniref:helix-turn-helix domain-containing protein n=1 Tax=Arthrobacter sp. CJ23 TaxID=2972479 RepID=UPI00215B80FC|nr:helix-turn-helix transcriptional regulator [Arthrobacter sp. CJ23]UVJ38037.1 helix-turn-helix domain-containing protein [Arthrobacter sp. CJ23]